MRMQRREGKAAGPPARTNEIKLHDFSRHVAGVRSRDREYKQVFLERVFLPPDRAGLRGVYAHRKSTTIQTPHGDERNEVAAAAAVVRFDGRGGVARGARVIRNRARARVEAAAAPPLGRRKGSGRCAAHSSGFNSA